MKYFCAVAELENMTEASKKLFVPQPTLSVSLSKLEQELGTNLFDRYNNRIMLNHAGKVFYERCLELLRAQSNIQQEMKEIADAPPKEITLVSTVQLLSTDIISCFLKEHPDYIFTQHLRDPQSMINLLKHGDADLAITSELGHLNSQFCYRPIINEQIYVVMNRRHPLSQHKQLTMLELKDESFCIHRPVQSEAGELDAHFMDMGSDPKIALIASESHLVLNAVALGVGITLVSSISMFSKEMDRYSDLAYIPLVKTNINRSIGLLWIKSHYFTRPQQEFRDYCISYLQGMHP